jgi:hypothetical protein
MSRIFRADGSPRYVRIYDNGGETADRYTAVFTGRYRHKTAGEYCYRAMSRYPFHPQGFGLWCSYHTPIDRPRSAHLGRRILFQGLPEDCRTLVVRDYCDLWDVQKPT